MTRAEEIADDLNKMELDNDTPYRNEDKDFWRAVPRVPGLDGRPMPRKAIKSKEESDDKFWDFMKQFLFGLWGFRQRPYPPGRPIDVAQAIGYKQLEKRYYDLRLGAAATAFLHKLQKGIPPWVPLKGREPKTYKQLQKEAIESKKRDMAVLEANDGVWPGVRTPSHALFLWASGQELAKVILGLRPWEVISIEQAMDQISYGGEWYREPLGHNNTGPPYIREWNRSVLRLYRIFYNLSVRVSQKLESTIPGFDTIMKKVQKDFDSWMARRMRHREEQLREENQKLYSDSDDDDDEEEDEDDSK